MWVMFLIYLFYFYFYSYGVRKYSLIKLLLQQQSLGTYEARYLN